jgi:hypothetical protein
MAVKGKTARSTADVTCFFGATVKKKKKKKWLPSD